MQMTPFQYVDFYDVPRTILISVGGKWILLQSAFDEERDDYEPEYSIYKLPSFFQPPPSGSRWDFLGQKLVCLGKIPVGRVEFDGTKRRTLRAAELDEIEPK